MFSPTSYILQLNIVIKKYVEVKLEYNCLMTRFIDGCQVHKTKISSCVLKFLWSNKFVCTCQSYT